MERILKSEEQGYKNLVASAKIMEAFSTHNARYIVQDVYLDLGQDWMWTTICRRGHFECQVLCPRDWRKIVLASTPEELVQAVREVMNGKYYND